MNPVSPGCAGYVRAQGASGHAGVCPGGRVMMTKRCSLVLAAALACVLAASGCQRNPVLLWLLSGHADTSAAAFTHWDAEGEIPTNCARCHSTEGFLDYIGADGTQAGVVDNPVTVVPGQMHLTCDVCHDVTNAPRNLQSVTFPSGAQVDGLGYEAVCMQCHQGSAAGLQVDEAVAQLDLPTDDTVSSSLGFVNIHYYAAAATQYGVLAAGGYEYSGNSYDARFGHVSQANTCIACHNPHSLQVDTTLCAQCHAAATPREIRSAAGSSVDYDGDGDTDEGIAEEIATMQEQLLTAMQAYGTEISGTAIAYSDTAYPYFFIDTNGNGVVDGDEGAYGNRYNAWTARLLRAAFNYQTSRKDPGAYVHGPKYILQLLYDSLQDVNSALSTPIDMTGMHRNDEGHFAGSAEAWRHWDADDPQEVEAECSLCHSATGLPNFLASGTTTAEPISNGLQCVTCHESATDLSQLRQVSAVTFPSGAAVDLSDTSNLCLLCHKGRKSTVQVDETIAGSAGPYEFINIHYYPSAAIMFGTDVMGGYEYSGKTYAGRNFTTHITGYMTCTECHMGALSGTGTHNVTTVGSCAPCHPTDLTTERFRHDFAAHGDFDGDGDVTESTRAEILGLEQLLYEQIKRYADDVLDSPLVYDDASYPYFFFDTNGNGVVDAGENIYPNRYTDFDAALLQAAYNYTTSTKEPSGYIHNARYLAQLMIDSIADLGGDVAANERP